MPKRSAIKRSNTGSKLQSAMEFLLTYGWAILIITVVLAVLYSLGIFNTGGLTPKTQPGACQIYRPNGPSTTFDINTEGVCNNGLPEYVAKFNGVTSNIILSATGMPTGNANVSFTGWVKTTSVNDEGIFHLNGNIGGGSFYGDSYNLGSGLHFVVGNGGTGSNVDSNIAINNGSWVFVAGTMSGNYITVYVNGKLANSGYSPYTTDLGSNSFVEIGYDIGGEYFAGSIANIQVYNTSLSSNYIVALYNEGIGGVPINLRNLVAWWPLNGNANDYSGEGLNGNGANILYLTSWETGYNIP